MKLSYQLPLYFLSVMSLQYPSIREELDDKGMTVKELAKKAGIAPTTLYSIIQRDTSIRFDTALKISNILNIPINSICKDNPYAPGEALPKLPKDKERMMIHDLLSLMRV